MSPEDAEKVFDEQVFGLLEQCECSDCEVSYEQIGDVLCDICVNCSGLVVDE